MGDGIEMEYELPIVGEESQGCEGRLVLAGPELLLASPFVGVGNWQRCDAQGSR